ncbi:MAG: polymer-forming cytoskeletal protein [Candidatus Omnitrophica bacterium]|nr:polymer-forming cytoskeletal protein [Candidatus Omnitrophota bacterium]MBU4303443.1 polymer-forming cytoskeletal protein [Candidatus Omnitrophota bacterium]MBU4418577.1 polymer-forming cytoskeletal protein [Candidatus Omnitrophota bacterium]MBU4467641.1 polymer-forming cytoskeletal protein [Candidatus Omnitrophota bacterium]MCG2708620.1 polymer-forming cytoskeletal protein [Candidatus Omnitrophota bacterium]
MFKKNDLPQTEDKTINIEAGMQGNLKFTGPVNLRLNGDFEGDLEARGVLIIGEKANVKAKTVKGDNITILGRVEGDIICSKRLELAASARVTGNIEAPLLVMAEGALLKGDCQMPNEAVESKERIEAKNRIKERQGF